MELTPQGFGRWHTLTCQEFVCTSRECPLNCCMSPFSSPGVHVADHQLPQKLKWILSRFVPAAVGSSECPKWFWYPAYWHETSHIILIGFMSVCRISGWTSSITVSKGFYLAQLICYFKHPHCSHVVHNFLTTRQQFSCLWFSSSLLRAPETLYSGHRCVGSPLQPGLPSPEDVFYFIDPDPASGSSHGTQDLNTDAPSGWSDRETPFACRDKI